MKNAKLQSLLIVFALTSTGLTILFTMTGTWLFLEYLIVSTIAIAGWLYFSFKSVLSPKRFIAPYILLIVLLLVLNTTRYASEFFIFIDYHYHSLFLQRFQLNYTNWFIFFVCLPVSLLLLGGFFLSKHFIVGFYFVWWGCIYCIAEALIQFKIEFGNLYTYKHTFFLGSLSAMLLFYIGVKGILHLIKPAGNYEYKVDVSQNLSPRQINLWSAFFISIVAVYGVTIYVQAGLLPVGVIAGSMIGGMVGWRKTTARYKADPYKLTPLYLLILTLFYIHVGEETLTDFSGSIAAITHVTWSDKDFNYLFALLGPIVWVFAGHNLWKGGAFGNYILWFLIVGMIIGEPTHLLIFPVVRMIEVGGGYRYFSGMYTALFPMIPAILALVTIINDHRTIKKTGANA